MSGISVSPTNSPSQDDLIKELEEQLKMLEDERSELYVKDVLAEQTYKKEVFDHNHAKSALTLYRNQHSTQIETGKELSLKLNNLKAEMKKCSSKGSKVKSFIFEQHKKSSKFRAKMLESHMKLRKRQEKIIMEKKRWRVCEICGREYEYSGNKIPRLLSCGHTVCTGCLERLAAPNHVQCPFDRMYTLSSSVIALPKNLAILHM